jgi:DNA-directed RNA polymerase alpha subunit/DNA-directed RNA polymerase subunit L
MTQLTKDYEDEAGLHFVLQNVHTSVANAIRRTILSDIPVVCVSTEKHEQKQCKITQNTSRFHNEIVKQRLGCVPVFTKQLVEFTKQYRLVVDVKNDTGHELRWVTTDDFQLQDKATEEILNEIETRRIFPHDAITNQPIDFLRLRPSIGTTIPGESIQLTADFTIGTAKENGMYNAVSKCAFHNVIDAETREETWAGLLQEYKNENRSDEEIAFEKKNFEYLDAHRCFKKDENGEPNEFEFIIKTLGIYTNYEIAYLACDILEKRFQRMVQDVQSQIVPIHPSMESRNLGYTSVTLSSIENAYDVILEKEDYTVGYLLEHYLYKLFYLTDAKEMMYVGFKKYHPHDDYSVIRMAFREDHTAPLLAKQYLVQASTAIIELMASLKKKLDPTNR